jgi:DNA-binding NtrC family response regulator
VRTLVLEEDDSLRETLVMILEELGHDVRAFARADAALDSLRANAAGMIVLFGVPPQDRNGGASFILRMVREDAMPARHSYICLTTSVSLLTPALRNALSAWSVPVVSIPFDLDALEAVVRQAEQGIERRDAALSSMRRALVGIANQ